MKRIVTTPPSGSRDSLPEDVQRREDLLQTLRRVFERHAFVPMDTPAFERVEVLAGKYGEVGEKLIFKILRRGEHGKSGDVDLALRYDLTLPLARYFAEHRAKLPTVFRRYQIGPVWRADRPARGRFREFYQCDVDIVNASSRLADAEILLVVDDAIRALGFQEHRFLVNSRRLLVGLLEGYGIGVSEMDAAIGILDKLDKQGADRTLDELRALGLAASSVEAVARDLRSMPELEEVETRAGGEGTADGIADVRSVVSAVAGTPMAGRVCFSPFLARGLDYYTGMIFEVTVPGVPGSIAAGGRYDNLMGVFSGISTPAVGGSLGVERLLLGVTTGATGAGSIEAHVLVTVWDMDVVGMSVELLTELHSAGVKAEMYSGTGKIGAQLKYANQVGCTHALIVGPEERETGHVVVRDMSSGTQSKVERDAVLDAIPHA